MFKLRELRDKIEKGIDTFQESREQRIAELKAHEAQVRQNKTTQKTTKPCCGG